MKSEAALELEAEDAPPPPRLLEEEPEAEDLIQPRRGVDIG